MDQPVHARSRGASRLNRARLSFWQDRRSPRRGKSASKAKKPRMARMARIKSEEFPIREIRGESSFPK
jgi:hypothetical protein